jgi:hypothetical protein
MFCAAKRMRGVDINIGWSKRKKETEEKFSMNK